MSKPTILIVEDETIIAADLAAKLRRLGYEVSATTGLAEEAIRLTREQHPELVLMDIRLAGAMDGVKAAELIRRELDLPVIYLTAHSDRETLQRAKLTEPFGFILKPFEERELATCIEMALFKHQSERRLRQVHEELEQRVAARTRELKEAQEVLRQVNQSLEQRVAERTAELQAANALLRDSHLAALNMMEDALEARRQAEEANAGLESANREMEAFIYSVSHDLRTPLRSIAGFAEMLLMDSSEQLGGAARDMLMRMGRAAEKMNAIIEDLLRLSRISRQEIATRPVDLSAAARAIIAELRDAWPDRQVSVQVNEAITTSADPQLIDIALANLLGNAWKFTKKTRDARIEFGAFVQAGEMVYYVRDNGAGFDPGNAATMFKPFHRLHTEEQFEGTGIGLAIVERIVKRHRGRVWAEGMPDQGAAFYFTLREK